MTLRVIAFFCGKKIHRKTRGAVYHFRPAAGAGGAAARGGVYQFRPAADPSVGKGRALQLYEIMRWLQRQALQLHEIMSVELGVSFRWAYSAAQPCYRQASRTRTRGQLGPAALDHGSCAMIGLVRSKVTIGLAGTKSIFKCVEKAYQEYLR